jgi:lactate dehydrogenase-like 2-hydroxyacid dehydrogenase
MIPVNSVLQVGFFPEIMQDEVLRRLTPVMMPDPQGPIPQQDVQAILTRPSYSITPTLLDQLPQVKMIACCGVGYDNLPLDYLKQRGIMASNTPGVLNDAVCELTIGMLFALLRQIPKAHEFVSKKQWSKEAFPFTTSLAGKTIGIVGMGRIGQELAARLLPFKVKISYHGPHDKHLSYPYISSLIELARMSDVLILCCPGGKETERMIHREVLEALGPSSYLINVARGTVINESDLLIALQGRKIAGAALDVFENEPNPDPRFLELPNVLLTPHIGSATQETRQAMTNLAIDNLDAFFNQRPLPTPIAM